MKFKHGDKVKCTINGTEITNAKISISKYGTPFICQNEQNGSDADDKLGYKYSWMIEKDFTDSYVTNLRPAVKSFDYPEVGDVYIDRDGNEREVLGVCGRVIFLSQFTNKDSCGSGYTKEELIKRGYTIKQDEPEEEIVELTLEEIAKMKGVSVDKIRVKE